MGKMSELALQIEELKRCGQLITDIADTLTEMFSTTQEVNDAEVVEESQEKAETEEEHSFEEVRGILAAKSRDGHTDEIKSILSSFGVNKLSDISPTQYAELLKKVEVI